MSLDKLIKCEDYIFTCPFCTKPLDIDDNEAYKNHGQVGYACSYCSVSNAETLSGKPFSRYNLGIMKNIELGGKVLPQLIVDETFYIHYEDDKWYDVHNDLAKDQTLIVLVEPMRSHHVFYMAEKPAGLVWVGKLIILPFIDTWNLSDQEATLSKIKTYVLFS